MSTKPKSPSRERQIADIVKAMQEFDITSDQAWSDLDELSTHTLFDGLEVDPDGVIIKGSNFKGPISVYVLLQYGSDSDDGFTTSDAFMGEFDGHFDASKKPVIDTVTIDTSPFYEGEKQKQNSD